MVATLVRAYEALLDLGEQQQAALEAADIEAYMGLLERREVAFQELVGLEPTAATLAADDRSAIQALIPRILAVDEALEVLLVHSAEATQHELNTLQQGLTALHSYVTETESPSYFIDRPS